MGSHAKLAPSSAKRWMTCPASVAREANYPDKGGQAADWGTAAHAILEQALLTQVHPLDVNIDDLSVESEMDDWAPAYRLIDRWDTPDLLEMRTTAQVAYEYVLFQGDLLAESTVNPGGLIGRDDCYGTADIQVHNPNLLEVVDLKGGKGVIVEPTDPQLKLYGVGALYQNPVKFRPESTTVKLTIVQPRAPHPDGPIRSIEMPAQELLDWMETEVRQAAAATDDPNAPAVPSQDACRFCKAKEEAGCREHTEYCMGAATAVFKPVAVGGDRAELAKSLTRNPEQLSAEEIRFILDNEKLISGWLGAVRNYASSTLLRGGKIPGYKMVAGRSQRKWNADQEDLFKRFKNLTRQDGKKLTKTELYESKFISPAQAEKQLKPLLKPSAWEIMQECVTKAPGAPTLAPESDSRPSVRKSAEEVFTPVAEDLPDFLK